MGKLKNKSVITMSERLRKDKKIMMKRLRKDKKVMVKRLCEDKEITMQRFREDKKMMMKRLLREGNKMMIRLLREDKKKKMMSVSKDNIKHLPEDVIILILARLPVKILMRFKCVCKSWYHLIKSPTFINIHQRSKNKSILIKRENDDDDGNTVMSFHAYESLNIISSGPDISSLGPEIPHIYKNYSVSWPCNGLLLCVSDDADPGIFVLCNPAIREYKLLPPIPFLEYPKKCSVYKYGLGFDSNINDYKVIAIIDVFNATNVSYVTAVYNLSTNSWRQIIHNLPYVYDPAPIYEGVLFNGALHWCSSLKGNSGILSFDVTTEVFNEIQLPEAIAQHHQICKIPTVVNDTFALFAYTYGGGLFEIWVMKEYGLVGSWTKHASTDKLLMTDNWYPRLLWKSKMLLIQSTKGMKVELVSYAIDTHKITDMGIFTDYSGYLELYDYEESFVSIK